jgi:carbonic anhydrase
MAINQTVRNLLTANTGHAGEFQSRFDDLQTAQHPDAVTVCCSDSRVLQDHIFGNDDPGHLFTVGNIGNRVVQRTTDGAAVSGDVLYPVAHTGTETVVVVGHTGCGAVTATYDDLTEGLDEPPGISHCLELLKPLLEPALGELPADVDRVGAISRLVEYNVDRQVQFLLDSEDIPADVTVVGVVYDFQDVYSDRRGEVHVINVDGDRSVETLREAHPDIADRVDRVWEY